MSDGTCTSRPDIHYVLIRGDVDAHVDDDVDDVTAPRNTALGIYNDIILSTSRLWFNLLRSAPTTDAKGLMGGDIAAVFVVIVVHVVYRVIDVNVVDGDPVPSVTICTAIGSSPLHPSHRCRFCFSRSRAHDRAPPPRASSPGNRRDRAAGGKDGRKGSRQT